MQRRRAIGAAVLVLAVAVMGGCSTSSNTAPGESTGPGRPYVSAHRGGAGYAPENTMMAYRNAARLGVDDFETDAWQTADGVLVLLHDQTLDRTTNCSGSVKRKTWAELQACDAGWWFSPGQGTTSVDDAASHPARGKGVTVPKAQELFAYAASFSNRYRPTVTIEIKDTLDAGNEAEALVALVQASGIKDRIIVQSFSARGIDRVKAIDPTIRTLYLTSGLPAPDAALDKAVRDGHDFVAPSASATGLDADFVKRAHAAGKGVVPWTPDSASQLQTLTTMGVDGLITNFPGCLLELQSRLPSTQLVSPELGNIDVALCKS
ncbi:MAG: glycerophosphodiester phosphodiesterase [Solimonas sp.]